MKCVNPECRREVDEAWAFCPSCGQDNRPPESRPAVQEHAHEYMGEEPYCIVCGCIPDVAGRSPSAQRAIAAISLGLGLLLFALFIDYMVVSFSGSGFFKDQIQDLNNMGTRRHPLGSTIAWIVFILGFAGVSHAFYIMYPKAARANARANRNRNAYWNYEDDKPWWQRRNRW